MGLDIRIPLGLIFLITGGIMVVYGFITRGSDLYAKSLGVNLNFGWGALMFLFGLVMFVAGRLQRVHEDTADVRPEEHTGSPRH